MCYKRKKVLLTLLIEGKLISRLPADRQIILTTDYAKKQVVKHERIPVNKRVTWASWSRAQTTSSDIQGLRSCPTGGLPCDRPNLDYSFCHIFE